MIIHWFDWVSSVLLFKITSIIGIHFFLMKTSKPNSHSKYFAIFSHFLFFITSWFWFSESQILHKPIYNKWNSKWNNKIMERWSKIKDDTIFIMKLCNEKFLMPMGYSLIKFYYHLLLVSIWKIISFWNLWQAAITTKFPSSDGSHST